MFWASPALRVGSFIPWHGQNKGLGHEGPNRFDFKQNWIRKSSVLTQHLFLMCSIDPRRPFWKGGFFYCEVFGQYLLRVHFERRGPSRAQGGFFYCGGGF